MWALQGIALPESSGCGKAAGSGPVGCVLVRRQILYTDSCKLSRFLAKRAVVYRAGLSGRAKNLNQIFDFVRLHDHEILELRGDLGRL